MDTKQLELFQPMGEDESLIFEQAKKAKEMIRSFYNKIELELVEGKKLLNESFAVLKLDVKVELVSDKDAAREPKSPRILIWQFTPSLILYMGSEEIQIGDNYKEFIESKVIKKWMNAIYTERTFSQREFHATASQHFALQLLSEFLLNNEFKEMLKSKVNNRDLVIYFNNRLLPPSNNDIESYMEREFINKVNNYYKKLSMLQEENWYYIGAYDDFINNTILLTELDNNDFLMKKVKKSFKSKNSKSIFIETFANDFLLLNNAAFIEQKTNTHGWDCDYVLSPAILNEDFTDISENSLYNYDKTMDVKKDLKKREYYLYLKGGDFPFFRVDILLPKKDLTKSKLKEIIAMTFFINTLKERA